MLCVYLDSIYDVCVTKGISFLLAEPNKLQNNG